MRCIKAYKTVAQQAFTPKKGLRLPASPSGAFSATQLEAAIKKVIRGHCVESDCVIQRSEGKATEESCSHEDMKFQNSSSTKTSVLQRDLGRQHGC